MNAWVFAAISNVAVCATAAAACFALHSGWPLVLIVVCWMTVKTDDEKKGDA